MGARVVIAEARSGRPGEERGEFADPVLVCRDEGQVVALVREGPVDLGPVLG